MTHHFGPHIYNRSYPQTHMYKLYMYLHACAQYISLHEQDHYIIIRIGIA